MNQSNDNQQIFKASGGAKHSVGTASKTYADVASTPAKKSPFSSVGSKKAAVPMNKTTLPAFAAKETNTPVKKSPSTSVGSKKAAAPMKKFAAGSKKPSVPVKKSPSSSRSLLIQHQDSSQLLSRCDCLVQRRHRQSTGGTSLGHATGTWFNQLIPSTLLYFIRSTNTSSFFLNF
jgi:hypothetical protein